MVILRLCSFALTPSFNGDDNGDGGDDDDDDDDDDGGGVLISAQGFNFLVLY